jgi:Uri superfamily endonuclease
MPDHKGALPRSSGTYALVLIAEQSKTVDVGALGTLDVEPGAYVYAGSAFGPGGLRARVGRHARTGGALHWHVDYLRAATQLEKVWLTTDDARRECLWAQTLADLPGATIPLHGFGASDCSCAAHLVRFDDPPPVKAFREALSDAAPRHASIRVVDDDDLSNASSA